MKTLLVNLKLPGKKTFKYYIIVLLVLLCLLFLILASSPLAAESRSWPPLFQEFDKNLDNMIDPREFIGLKNARINDLSSSADGEALEILDFSFSSVDMNNDGLIDANEYQRASLASSLPSFPGQKPMMNRALPNFDDFDLNGDGKLEKDEFYKARSIRIKERAEAGMPMRRISEAPTFEQIDLNSDGIVDKNEFNLHRTNRWRGGPRTQ